MKIKNGFYSFLLVIIVFSGCHRKMKTETVPDTQGMAPRIVVINSDATELLLAIKAGPLIVGKDNSDSKAGIFQPLEKIPRVGKWSNPSIEAIVALHPNVVVTYDRWPEKKELDDKLAPFGIKVVRVAGYRIETLASDIRKLGDVTGNTKEAEELIGFIEQYKNLIKERCKNVTDKKNMYYEFSPYTALGKGSGGDELLRLVSTENVTSEFEMAYPKVSPEWLLARDPDIILIAVKKDEIFPEVYDNMVLRQGWEKLSAVKENRVYLVSNEISSGPRGIIGALYFAKWAYPDKFKDIDPGKIHAEWLKKFYNISMNRLYVYP
ncbi:MAG: ABC transporter substrate-binding protein [Bacteroidales bacterium]|jgi:iron complex transport system substrate-binding protein